MNKAHRSRKTGFAVLLGGVVAGLALFAVRRQPASDPWADWLATH
ncbi:hypothetical protein SH584_05915 [Sphingomonas sp. LY29]|nr:hypothetical protein [Sphingomonas sp. LY29]WRP26956.1 hypothetical protein SH584_05915 [Sphingomonas sp. LY29]